MEPRDHHAKSTNRDFKAAHVIPVCLPACLGVARRQAGRRKREPGLLRMRRQNRMMADGQNLLPCGPACRQVVLTGLAAGGG